MKLPAPNAGSFTPTPEGQHLAVCTRFIDLGTQTTETAWGVKQQRKVLIGWEIPKERTKWERDGVEHEGPVLHYERFTFSTHEKARFRQVLESWRGKPFRDEDFGSHEKAFDVRNLLGVGAYLQIAHKHENGKVYANLQAIMMPPGGKESWPRAEGQTIYLALTPDEFSLETYQGLSENLQNAIASSPEYQAMFRDDQPDGYSPPPRDDMDDEIPF